MDVDRGVHVLRVAIGEAALDSWLNNTLLSTLDTSVQLALADYLERHAHLHHNTAVGHLRTVNV